MVRATDKEIRGRGQVKDGTARANESADSHSYRYESFGGFFLIKGKQNRVRFCLK